MIDYENNSTMTSSGIPVADYHVNGVLVNSKSEMKAAHRELEAFQEIQTSFDADIMDYKEWAKEAVVYSNIDDREAIGRLNKCNDSYALMMFSNCLTPYQNGITLKAVFSSWVISKATQVMNPNMEIDMSRALLGIRDAIVSKYALSEKEHPHMSALYKPIMESLESMTMSKSVDNMMGSVNSNLKEHTIDSMIMTPRQLAAIKLNFMEQCYVDMRDGSSPAHVRECEKNYNNAVEHLSAIARNSGFDMSVVAAEERYLAGLKIMENPDYANLFSETEGIYGAKPYVVSDSTLSPTWDGTFNTADGHSYYVGNHVEKGAFTVRKPVFALGDKSVEALEGSIERRAEQCAVMMMYLESKDCPINERNRDIAGNALRGWISTYKNNMISLLQDDGIAKSKNAASKMWSSTFEDVYESTLSSDGKSAIKDFETELNHVLDKEIITRMGGTYTPEVAQYIATEGKSGDKAVFDSLEAMVKARAKEHKSVDKRTGLEILKDMRANYMETMQADEIAKLMLHVGANMEQGVMSHGDYGRDYATVESAKKTSKQEEKSNKTGVDLSKKSSRDVPDIPKSKSSDEEEMSIK